VEITKVYRTVRLCHTTTALLQGVVPVADIEAATRVFQYAYATEFTTSKISVVSSTIRETIDAVAVEAVPAQALSLLGTQYSGETGEDYQEKQASHVSGLKLG
jgi:hypothetical protein